MKITANIFSKLPKAEAIALALFEKEDIAKNPLFRLLTPDTQTVVRKFIAGGGFSGKETETKVLPIFDAGVKKIILLGRGERAKWHRRKALLLPRRMVQAAKSERVKTIAMDLNMLGLENDTHPALARKGWARDIAINALMAHFEYRRKVMPKEGWPEVKEMMMLMYDAKDSKATKVSNVGKTIQEGIREGIIIGEAVNETRVLNNTPGGEMTPLTLADAARRTGKKHGIRVTIFDEKKMKALGFGGVLGVGKGSDIKPRFIIMEYRRGGGAKPLVLVGKGVTFDTGGLNLKPSNGIYEMHMDMSGGAAVIHAVAAIARLKLPLNVVGLVPAVENMPSGSSYHPGDLLKTHSGKTIEVLNTDAEGRIILADALSYAKKFNPALVVDIATLTGAAMTALGQRVSGLFTQNEKLEKLFRELGTQSGDEVWPMPLWDEYDADIQATFGDVANIGKTHYGGAITAAAFLKQFAEGYPWAHLDIAPTMTTIDGQYLAKGASGVGVRFFVELAKYLVENKKFSA